jgi:hypothetical protein
MRALAAVFAATTLGLSLSTTGAIGADSMPAGHGGHGGSGDMVHNPGADRSTVAPPNGDQEMHMTGNPLTPLMALGDRYIPKPVGTKEKLTFWFGPYVVGPGQDLNRPDLQIPIAHGMILQVEPELRRVSDLSVPTHQEAHIHHAHWFALDPGNPEDNYTGGNTEWIFGNGDEETKANFEERSAADPNGPVYGEYVNAPQLMIYMLHNKTNQPLVTWITLDVTYIQGSPAELTKKFGRPYHDLTGVLFGRTYNVPRQPKGDGLFETTKDQKKPIEWVATQDGTMIGTGSHLHPGGIRTIVENMGSASNPCPNDHQGYGGTLLLRSDVMYRKSLYSEDYQTEVTNPAWRAPIHKGDRIRITGLYENKYSAWYTAMTHEGSYIDPLQPPIGRCKPYLVGPTAKKRVHGKLISVTAGVPNRPWGPLHDLWCGRRYGKAACEPPFKARVPGVLTNTVTIANFIYHPGDRSLTGAQGGATRIKKGTSLTFINADQPLLIRHSITTCMWPCNGRYVSNYPRADGVWDSGTLGYDPVDGGTPNPIAHTPKDLPVGKYAYFCRIHPWMRGAFEVIP